MSDSSVSAFHKSTSGSVKKSELISSGRDTTVQKSYYYNIGVFPDVIGFVQFAAQHLIAWSRSADGKKTDPVDIDNIVPPDPSSLPISTVADRYTRAMLECMIGYPLYEPHPFSQLSKEYLRHGVRVGDVGFVRKDGAFDFLFNVCPPQNASINPPFLPDSFSLTSPEHSETRGTRPLSGESCFFPRAVVRTESGEYICEGSDGAILELPEGAVQDEAVNTGPFEALARLHGVHWYEYTMNRGRGITNGSLYLVTSFTKCTQWGIAVFDRPCKGVTFVSSPPRWNGSKGFSTRVSDSNEANQCVFLQGYKIMIRQDIYDNLRKQQPAQRIRGGGGTGFLSKLRTAGNAFSLTKKPTVKKSDEVVLQANFNTSPIHPSDLINAALLSKNFPNTDYAKLVNIARSYASKLDEYGCASLEKISGLDNADENSYQIRRTEAQAFQGARDGHASIPGRMSAAVPRPSRSFDHSRGTGDQDISVSSQPVTTALATVYSSVMAKQHGGEAESSSALRRNRELEILRLIDPDFDSNLDDISQNANITLTAEANKHSIDGQFTDFQRNFIRDYIVEPEVLPDIKNDIEKSHLPETLQAGFNEYQAKNNSGPCFERTRVALLREVGDWFTSPTQSRIYILFGLAGTGKSTVAYTIASRAANLNLLGASFFFSRDEVNCKNANTFYTTIASQLSVHNKRFWKGDVSLTAPKSTATEKDPQVQLKTLILDPLQNIAKSWSRPTLIVIGALDECAEKDRLFVLTGLRKLVQVLPSFKVILTTRTFPLFDNFLQNQIFFHLRDIEDQEIDGDICRYLKHRLSLDQIQKHYPTQRWCATDEQTDFLVRAAGRFFIIASTTVRYILDKSASDPAAQIQKLLHAFTQDHTPFVDLDHFYTFWLRILIPANCDDHDMISCHQSVVGAVALVQSPLPVPTLAHFINIDVNKIRAVLNNLQSVILLGDDDVPRIYHKSFLDYLTVRARCEDPRLGIFPKICNTQITICCFQIMEKHLRYNILGRGNLSRFMSTKDDQKRDEIADELLEENIPHQLRYACIYWANHLEAANAEDVDLMIGLQKFTDKRLLYWLEVLSLIGELQSAHLTLHIVLKLLKSTSSDLYQLLSDALRFLLKFGNRMQSPLHVYYSALPFTPTDSLLYRRYINQAEYNVCTIEGGPEKWGVTKLSHGKQVDVIKFSLDNALLFSCSEKYYIQETLGIWDAATGMLMSATPGQRFAVTNDFSTVASSEDNTIMFHEANGSTRAMLTTSSSIQRLTLSESGRIAVALSDGAVWLWDSINAGLINSFKDGVTDSPQLQFSPTGTRLAYSSANGIVKLRDGITGGFIADLRCESGDDIKFSGDGTRIATWSRSSELLMLWNSASGRFIGSIKDFGRLDVFSISVNGSMLATANALNVQLWEENRDHLTKSERLPCISSRSMAFSLDNTLAIATDFGLRLYNVKTHSFFCTLRLDGKPTALAFSQDCTRLAVGNNHGDIYLWDIRDINPSNSASSEEKTAINALALSRDCTRLACGFKNGTVELWGTNPMKQQIVSNRQAHTKWVEALAFGPDGRLFTSKSDDGIIKLWIGKDGSLYGTLKAPSGLRAVALSNSVLVAGWDGGVTLWSLDTLIVIHTIKKFGDIASAVSIADNGGFIAVAFRHNGLSVFNTERYTTIATFAECPDSMTFLSDSSQLVAQSNTGTFLLFNITNEETTKTFTQEHLIQVPDMPLWHGTPIWHCRNDKQHYLSALFSEHKNPIPVLWIPVDISVTRWAQGSSMIALGCEDGRIILLRLNTSYVA